MDGDQVISLAFGGTFFVLLAAIGLGFGLLSDADLTRADERNERLKHDLDAALRVLAGNGEEHYAAAAELNGRLAAAGEDLIEAARRIKRHAIARRHVEAQLASCRCVWPADGPTVDLGDASGLAEQVERFLAERGDGS